MNILATNVGIYKGLVMSYVQRMWLVLLFLATPIEVEGLPCFYSRVLSKIIHYLAHGLHPSYIIMPLVILIYGLALFSQWSIPKTYKKEKPSQHSPRSPPGLRFTVDCHIAFPAAYMIFTSIMLLPNLLVLLKNWRRIKEMSFFLLHFSPLDIILTEISLYFALILWSLRDPPPQFLSDGILYYGVIQSRATNLLKRGLRFLLLFFLLTGIGTTSSATTPFFPTKLATTSVLPSAFARYREHIATLFRAQEKQTEEQQKYELLMAQLATDSHPRVVDFDADAFDMATDNCASITCTPFASDLYEIHEVTNTSLSGVGKSKITHMGKAKYEYIDNSGATVLVDDHEVAVCPDLPCRILAVTNWGKQLTQRRSDEKDDKTHISSYHGVSYLYCNLNKHVRTINHHDHKGIPIIRARLANKNPYSAFSCCFPCYNTAVVTDDDDTDYCCSRVRRSKTTKLPIPSSNDATPASFNTTATHQVPVAPPSCTDAQLLMSYHLQFGHLPFARLQQAAKQGILPRRLGTCAVPKCAGCLFGKAKRRPWRTSAKPGNIAKAAVQPGDVVSVDQLISKTPGLIAQSVGILTRKRHMVATVFVDHASGLDFVHTQPSTSAADTVLAKIAFEQFASSHNVQVKHYHCDNGIFAAKVFRDAVTQANQTISFCGVNAHHQNGVAERRIGDLSERTRSMLIDARHRNPYVTDNLWPFALRLASEIGRTMPRPLNTTSPLEQFSRVSIRPKISHFHPFGCPVWVLAAPLQAGQSIPKWDQRSRVGCYLGVSQKHATSVSLILHPRTGLVSPQFHCVYDNVFETLADLQRFAILWPKHASTPTTSESLSDYTRTAVPRPINAPGSSVTTVHLTMLQLRLTTPLPREIPSPLRNFRALTMILPILILREKQKKTREIARTQLKKTREIARV
jgi:hypothetical protein